MSNELSTDWQRDALVRLGIATDHGGVDDKARLCAHLADREGITVEDLGPHTLDPADDYPDYASLLARRVALGELDAGILLCRSGIGMSIAANRFRGVRAALVRDGESARLSRSHNASNILVFGSENRGNEDMATVVDAWLSTPFSEDRRHCRRLCKVDDFAWDETAGLRDVDPALAQILEAELCRRRDEIDLIASENLASVAVRTAMASSLTDKYAEGYPGARCYPGCEQADRVETLAIERACKLYGAEAANAQPHSGSQANMVVFFALLSPGDTVLSMRPAHGGHLSHGAPENASGRLYRAVHYDLNPETEQIDYEQAAELARKTRPTLLIAGASTYSQVIDYERLGAIATEVGAAFLVDMAHVAGLVAAGVHPSPVPYADVVTSTTHKTLRGPRGGLILAKHKFAERIDAQVFPGVQGGPHMHTIAAKAVCLHEAAQPEFRTYQQRVVRNAARLAQALDERRFRIVSGGTKNHQVILDLRPKRTLGAVVADALEQVGIAANKVLVPYDPEASTMTSGLRLGTPAVTARGFGEDEMDRLADCIDRIATDPDSTTTQAAVRKDVRKLCRNFPPSNVVC